MNAPVQKSPRERNRAILARALTGLLAITIAILTLMPSTPPPPSELLTLSDKAYHAIAFAVLVLPMSLLTSESAVRLAVLAFLFGTVIEFIQPLVGRSFEGADLSANAIGITIGIALGRTLRITGLF